MSYAFLLSLRLLVTIWALTFLGCGQPKVYIVTSTTVGLEATPPMSDGSGVPRVTVGYKRAEVALVPVCPVEKYKDPFTWLALRFWEPEIPPCSASKGSPYSDSKTTDPSVKTVGNTRAMEPATVPESDGPHSSVLTKVIRDAEDAHSPSTRQDSYSTLGVFRLGLSWFGPARIEQFVATGQAAVEIQQPLPPIPTKNVSHSVKNSEEVTSSSQNKPNSQNKSEAGGNTSGKGAPSNESSSKDPDPSSSTLPSLPSIDTKGPTAESGSAAPELNESKPHDNPTAPVSSPTR